MGLDLGVGLDEHINSDVIQLVLQNHEAGSLGTSEPHVEIRLDLLSGRCASANVPVVSVMVPDDRGETEAFLRNCANTVVNLLKGGMSKDGLIHDKN